MAVEILTGDLNRRNDLGRSERSVMFCNSTMTAFGPVAHDRETLEGFKEWLSNDPRSYHASELERLWGEYKTVRSD